MNPRSPLPPLLLALLLPVAGPNPATANSDHAPASATTGSIATDGHDALAEERASLMRIGEAKLASGDATSALIAYRQVATSTNEDEEEASAQALLGMARAYRLGGNGVKAAATYEHLVGNHPTFSDLPTALLELGRTLRDLGSPKLAINRFYSVIHSTLKMPEAESERYRRVVRTAQFEIAETHLYIGNYEEASRFFKRLDLLDLAPADRGRARFKAAYCLALSGDRQGAVIAFNKFINQDPQDENSPEARFLLAQLLADLGRKEESLRVTITLLQSEYARGDATGRWRIWQRRTGNQLANQFYQQADYVSALILYRALDALDPAPAWRVPVLYQIGLCQERLQQPGNAVTTYDTLKKIAGEEPSPELADFTRMAAWRSEQISWVSTTRDEIIHLRPTAPEPTSAPANASSPSSSSNSSAALSVPGVPSAPGVPKAPTPL